MMRQSNFSYEPKYFRCHSPDFKKSSFKDHEIIKTREDDKMSVISRKS